MYSVKPGRGPSAIGAVAGIFAGLFGVIWTIAAASMGAPGFMVAFGVIFIIMALVGVGYNIFNAANKNRMSSFDITTQNEESDPIAKAMGYDSNEYNRNHQAEPDSPRKIPGGFCPYCGEKVKSDFDFCPKCGKDI